MKPTIAVLVPCRNEEATIESVVREFKAALPSADVFVYDNGSTDSTTEVARAAGAIVRTEPVPGKGNVVRRMFADVEADVFVLVDGDATYDAASAPKLIDALFDGPHDLVTGARVADDASAYRPGHRFGNALFTGMVRYVFQAQVRDVLSGYRVMSRRFVKSFPALATGFEIETELVVHALALRQPTLEIDTPYRDRPEGSASKLSAVRDGTRILSTILRLTRRERPVAFFGTVGLTSTLVALTLAYPIVVTYMETGLVPRFPTAILCTGLVIVGILCVASGLILENVSRSALELRRLAYLRYSAPSRPPTVSGSTTSAHERSS